MVSFVMNKPLYSIRITRSLELEWTSKLISSTMSSSFFFTLYPFHTCQFIIITTCIIYHSVTHSPQVQQETLSSLTNRATLLCKRNGVADLVKHALPHMCFACFGRFALKGVGISTGEPNKLGSPGTPISCDRRRSWLQDTCPSPHMLPLQIW